MDRKIRANLRQILAHLYPDEVSIRRVCDDAGIDLARVIFSVGSLNIWHGILTEAHKVNQVIALLDIVEAEDEYKANVELRTACAAYRNSLRQPNQDTTARTINQVSTEASSTVSAGYQHDIFISYSHADHGWVWNSLLPRLESVGLRVCIDNRDFKIGVPLLTNMEAAVERSRHTLIVMTPAWLQSEWTEFESLLVATTDPAGRRARLLPLMLISCQLPLRLQMLVYSDFTQVDQHDQQFERLVRQLLATPITAVHAVEEHATFVVGPPITHPRHFFGYEREMRRLFNLLRRSPLQNAAIIGPLRSGKTSFLLYLRDITKLAPSEVRSDQRTDWLPTPERYRWIFVDFQDRRMSTQAGFLRYLLTSLELPIPDPCDMDHFSELVSRHLRSPTIVLLDEIGVALESYQEFDRAFWQNLRALATTQTRGNLAFVLSAPEDPSKLADDNNKSSPFFNIFGYTLTLGPITEVEARSLIASSPLSFPTEDIEWILAQSGRWPILLQALCRERLLALEDGETDDRWRAEGLRQIEPFRHLLDSH